MEKKTSSMKGIYSTPSLNETMLPQGICLGCGINNPHGFRAKFWRGPDNTDEIIGRVTIPEHGCGWPGIVHGGSLFTVLDCLAAWTVFAARPGAPTVNVTQSATSRYFKPARPGQILSLAGTLRDAGHDRSSPVITFGQIHNDQGQLLAELEASLMTLKPAVFKRLTGLAQLPPDYQRHFPDL
ncbi:MAG: PaaI family thioesterase [Elusimicrobia bacterium]|nr:PaaI family thioesterase [Elusimicrobiota bacterium]